MTTIPDLVHELPRIAVKCTVCKGVLLLRGPIERVNFLLASMTTCPCGGVHETLPNAASHVYVLK